MLPHKSSRKPRGSVIESEMVFPSSLRNSCMLVCGKPAVIHDLSDGTVYFKRFCYVYKFFDTPFPSSNLLIYSVPNVSNTMYELDIEHIQCKYYALPHNSCSILIPLLHTMRYKFFRLIFFFECHYSTMS